MLTLITGTPGAGKSLKAVWDFARKVPGSTVEMDGTPVPRRLLTNIKGLLIEHTHIDGPDLDNWHTWAKPGDVIVFDEVQEVWRPRGLGTKVPDCIAKLETHRHMGVDIILISQHPMLVDPNIRRLVNQHIHVRRLTKRMTMCYEWDHCSNPQATKSCVHSGLWRHPKAAYGLYKSAQLHTKPTARVPKVAFVGVAALVACAVAFPATYQRLGQSLGWVDKPQTELAANVTKTVTQGPPPGMVLTPSPQPATPEQGAVAPAAPAVPVVNGCIVVGPRCECFTDEARPAPRDEDMCAALTAPKSPVLAGTLRAETSGYTPTPTPAGLHF